MSHKYALPWGSDERLRLDRQFLLMHTHFDEGRLIFDKTVHLTDEAVVLDCGTGSGAWLRALADKVPRSVQLYGIDITSESMGDTSQFPNLHFLVHDVRSLPMEWTGKFDLVSQNMMILGLTAEGWNAALKEIYRVLKPGGTLQIREVVIPKPYPLSRFSSCNAQFRHWFHTAFKAKQLLYDTPVQLPKLVQAAGFTGTRILGIKPYPWGDSPLLQEGCEIFDHVMQLLGPFLITANQCSPEEHRRVLEGAIKEIREGRAESYLRMINLCTRKPTGLKSLVARL